MKRLFAAIKVQPTEIFLARYYSFTKSLQHEKIRWVSPENIHITLKFFGETPDHHIPAIVVALREAAKETPPFSFSIQDIGVFGSSYKPRALWFGLEPQNEVVQLASKISFQLSQIGIEQDRQNFVPHLTIARMNYIEDKKVFQQAIDKNKACFIQKEEVNKFHLFESILRPEGPMYGVVESFALDTGC